MLIAMAGLPGTGKSYLARHLAQELPGIILDKDALRAALFPPAEIEYSTRQDDFCLSIMLQTAEYMVRKDPHKHIILDGRPFARRYQRADLMAFAERYAMPLCLIECVCTDDTARRRLEHDVEAVAHVARNRNYALYLSLKANFEPLDEPRLVVDTDQDTSACLDLCLAYIRAR